MEPGGAMHALVHLVLADIGMPVKVNDSNIALNMRRQPPNIWVTNRMIPAKYNGKDSPLVNIADRFGDLVKALLKSSNKQNRATSRRLPSRMKFLPC